MNNAVNFSKEFNFEDKLAFSCEKYNVIECVAEKHRGRYDFFTLIHFMAQKMQELAVKYCYIAVWIYVI